MRSASASLMAIDRARAMIGISLILLLTYLVYRPGLSGGFLFDDFSNLAVLGYYGHIDNWDAFWLYLLSGFSGPTGRPVSTLSFLLDTRTWPADPLSFKHTNVLIHLTTGLILYALVHQLARALNLDRTQATWVALLTAALWLLHPFWVSTTLYVVQRMAQLSTLFVLLGLWLYVRTRLRHPPEITVGTLIGSACAIGIFGLLAVLSKENGVLLPLLAITVEITVLAAYDRTHGRIATKPFLWWRALLLGVPTAVLMLYMAQGLPALLAGDPGTRAFTPGERLLIQGQILWEYLYNIFLPKPYPGGIFNDHTIVSGNTTSILVSLLGWGAILGLTGFAWFTRTRWPALSLAILFFLAGHILESTFLQLELYFEHRNYLPAALLGLPLALYITSTKRLDRTIRGAIVIGVLLGLALLTYMRADLWGQPFQQALKWAQVNPSSARAQHYLSSKWIETGNILEAERLNLHAIELSPQGLPWLMQAVMLDCRQNRDPSSAIKRVEHSLIQRTRIGTVERVQIAKLLDFTLTNQCHHHNDPIKTLELIKRIESMQNITPALQTILDQRAGQALLLTGQPKLAYERYARSTKHISDDSIVLANAAILATHGAHQYALSLLNMKVESTSTSKRWSIDRLRRYYIDKSGYYEREQEYLKQRILEDLANQSMSGIP